MRVLKGSISLFLCVLITPFLTIALLLVEMGKYNSAVSILDESMGVSSTSLLANYDSYLHDRWGLLAVDQDVDINSKYNTYLDKNSGVLGNGLTIDKATAKGQYPLSDSEILYNQILEFSKLNAPTDLAANFANISDLIDKLEGFANIGKLFDSIGSGADAVDSSITISEAADDLKETAKDLDKLKGEYESSYNSLKSAVDSLGSALSSGPPTDKDKEKEKKKIEEYKKKISKLKSSVDSAASSYSSVLGKIVSKLTTFKDKMTECNDSMESIKTDIESAATNITKFTINRQQKESELDKVNKKIETMKTNHQDQNDNAEYKEQVKKKTALEEEIANDAVSEGIASSTQTSLKNVSEGWKNSFNTYNDATIGEIIKGFKSLQAKVDGFSSSSVSAGYTLSDSYHNVSVAGYISAKDIDGYIDSQADSLKKGSLSSLIDGITTFFNSILKTQLFYDPSLSSYIDVNYYKQNIGGLPGDDSAKGGVLAVITDIGKMMTASKNFGVDIVKIKWLSALKELKNIITQIINLGKDLVAFAIGICKNIVDLFTSYDRLYYTTYSTFNLPCRTDYVSGSPSFTAMTGYSFSKDTTPQKMKGSNLLPVDDLLALIDTISSATKGTGKDLTFSGAELEYVLFGSNSEIANQMYTFASLYIFRLLMDLPAVLTNAEVQSLAASTTLGYPVVMIIEIIAEPLVDTILLVNGSEVPFYETEIYLTPTGVVSIIEELVSICKLTSQEKSAAGDKMIEAFGSSKKDYKYQQSIKSHSGRKPNKILAGFFEFDYREYCFIIMLLTVTKEQQMGRLKNLIQMETLYYYSKQPVIYTFDLKHSYTYVESTAKVKVKQLMPSLSDASVFTVDRKQYRGY